MQIRLRSVSCFVLFAFLASNSNLFRIAAQEIKSSPPMQRSKSNPAPAALDPTTHAIADAAFSVPPEFGADVLIQLAASTRVRGAAMKSVLLDKAFDLAARAPQQVKFSSVTRLVDSRSGSTGRADSMGLDQLSLEARVVQAMLAFDPVKARGLAERIQFPTLQPLDCTSPLVYDLRPFYFTIGQVGRQGFTPAEKANGNEVAFLMPYVTPLQSHAQVAPVADMLLTAGLSPADMGQLSGLFARALSKLDGDPRSFAASADSTVAIRALLGARGTATTELLPALRQYLVSNYSGERCGEITVPVMPTAVTFFNEHYASLLLGYRLPPIAQSDIATFRAGPSAPVIPYWESPNAKALLREIRKLKFGDGDNLLRASAKTTSEWTTHEADFLSQLEAWGPDSEPSPAEFFDEKSILYMALIDALPAGSERADVSLRYLNFLAQSSGEAIDPAEWFYPAHLLLTRCAEAHNCSPVVDAFVSSRNPILNLYGKMDRDIILTTNRAL